MSQANIAQIEYWNGEVGERWARQQARIDMNLSTIMTRALSFADAQPGEHVLDIGCGCGSTTLAFAEVVGQGGAVKGVDISHPMLEVARKRAAEAGLSIAFEEADAADDPFAPEFDLVFSRFGVMFFADPAAAFANIRTSLKPAGRLRFVCWRTAPENQWASAPYAAAKHLLPPPEPRDPRAPGPFAFGEADYLEGILKDAGYSGIALEKFDSVMNMGRTPDEAAIEAMTVGPLASAAAALDDDARTKIRETVATMMAQFETAAGITPPAACWLVRAKA